jgi:hypothetical protein
MSLRLNEHLADISAYGKMILNKVLKNKVRAFGLHSHFYLHSDS